MKILTVKIKGLMAKKPSKSFSNLQKEVEAIEWKIQTTPLSLQEEKRLIDQVKRLEAQISIHKKIEQLNQRKLELTTELKALEARARRIHESMVKEVEKSRRIREEMIRKHEEAKKLKDKADNVHKLFLQVKEKIAPVKEELKKTVEEMRKLKEEMAVETEEERKKREESLQENVAKSAIEKLKRGEKLSWQEFKILAEKGLA